MSNSAPTAKVVKVLDDYTLIINKGEKDGIREDHRFLIYSLGEEIKDPDSGQSLGQIEIVKGKAKPLHIQERITHVKSDEMIRDPDKHTITKQTPPRDIFAHQFLHLPESTTEVIEPGKAYLKKFSNAAEGDLVKIIP